MMLSLSAAMMAMMPMLEAASWLVLNAQRDPELLSDVMLETIGWMSLVTDALILLLEDAESLARSEPVVAAATLALTPYLLGSLLDYLDELPKIERGRQLVVAIGNHFDSADAISDQAIGHFHFDSVADPLAQQRLANWRIERDAAPPMRDLFGIQQVQREFFFLAAVIDDDAVAGRDGMDVGVCIDDLGARQYILQMRYALIQPLFGHHGIKEYRFFALVVFAGFCQHFRDF